MILHKLLFFKLPYRCVFIFFKEFLVSVDSTISLRRYAAAGDASGEPISREEESDKMERLEREILDYPGFVFLLLRLSHELHFMLTPFPDVPFRFKSNPNLVSGFESRKLPRAFLVLLENLLHKTPTVRPSSERVATAIRDGKACPSFLIR